MAPRSPVAQDARSLRSLPSELHSSRPGPVPAGDHVLELTADQLGFRDRRQVRIVAGRELTVTVELPRVPLYVNATPWADVLVDGAAVGQTPLGTLNQSFGTHQIEFSHPAFGTHRRTVVLSQREVTRVSVDMRVP